jgi:neutral ceramidase
VVISRRRLISGAAAVAASSMLAPALFSRPARAGTGLAVSFGKVAITPDVGGFMAGYGVDAPRASTGTMRSLFARCVIVWDGGYPNVVVTADVLAFPRSMNLAVRSRVATLGVPSSDFILTATHTHNGPVLVDRLDPYMAYNMTGGQLASVQAYSNWLSDQIVQLVADTIAGTSTPCTLDYRVVDQNFSFNREGLPYVERDVPMLVARSLAGDPLVVLFGYGCHPVSAGYQTLYDPDYPGEAVSWVEDLTGTFAQFLLGPAGDQDPVGTRGWELRYAQGTGLGQAIINALGTPGRPVTGPIATAYTEVTLPLDITDTPANLSAVRAAFVARYNNTGLPGFKRRHAEVMIRQIDTHSFATTVPLPLQVWKLAGNPTLRIALTGGELVSGYGVYFRAHYGGSNGIWIAGYANEVPAYIPSDELLFTHPGMYYACGWEPDYPGIGGGAMSVYGWLGHFKGRAPGTSTNGIEQILISNLTALL